MSEAPSHFDVPSPTAGVFSFLSWQRQIEVKAAATPPADATSKKEEAKPPQ